MNIAPPTELIGLPVELQHADKPTRLAKPETYPILFCRSKRLFEGNEKTQQMFISGDYTLMITQLWLYYTIFSKKDPEILHTGLLTILESFSKETKSENTVRRQKVGKHGHHETDVSVFQFYSIVSMFYK